MKFPPPLNSEHHYDEWDLAYERRKDIKNMIFEGLGCLLLMILCPILLYLFLLITD